MGEVRRRFVRQRDACKAGYVLKPDEVATIFAALDAAEARAEAAEQRVRQMLSLGAIPVEDVARNFMRNEESAQARSVWNADSHARLAEVLRRARIDGANAARAALSPKEGGEK